MWYSFWASVRPLVIRASTASAQRSTTNGSYLRSATEKDGNSSHDLGCGKGEDRGCPESTMGKNAKERRAEAKRCHNTEKEDHVSRRSKENCRCSTGAVGEGQGCTEEVGVIGSDF